MALTIAGSDPSGGAGIQADLKTFHQFGVYGTSVITLLTVQNTVSVKSVSVLSPQKIEAQLQAVLEDIPPNAAKTGALGSTAVIRAIAKAAENFKFPLVVDPVMVSKHGALLLDGTAVRALEKFLLPKAYLITPNLYEAEALTGFEARDRTGMIRAAKKILERGARAVLVKGGHLRGEALDVLCVGTRTEFFSGRRIRTSQTHGTGCTFSAAITAELAKGRKLIQAVRSAKIFINAAIRTNPGLGRGAGPLNHHVKTLTPE